MCRFSRYRIFHWSFEPDIGPSIKYATVVWAVRRSIGCTGKLGVVLYIAPYPCPSTSSCCSFLSLHPRRRELECPSAIDRSTIALHVGHNGHANMIRSTFSTTTYLTHIKSNTKNSYIVNLNQDHHHKPTVTGGAQPEVKGVNLRVWVAQIVSSNTFEVFHG